MRKARAAALGGSAAALAGLDEDEVEAWAEASGEGRGAAGGKAAELAGSPGEVERALRDGRHDQDRSPVSQDADRGCRFDGPTLAAQCQERVVDLRDGPCGRTAPRISSPKFADVEYRGLDHACEDWERAVEQIAGERQSPSS